MKRLAKGFALVTVVFGGVWAVSPAIAQTDIEVYPSTLESTEDSDLLPTENAGSADLITSPARTNSSTLSDVNASPFSGTVQELRILEPEVTLMEGTDARSNGPANADHVQFVFN
ncbi:MAG: hypothetical protein VKL39_05550 [Leptolyngbyaceae bacterium]|nr:hypothetical protein [Leptolyngbyaceae bacterium]